MSENTRLFMMLTGPSGVIKGESRVADRKDWIEIDEWDWNMKTPGKGDDAEAVVPSIFSFSKRMDRASTPMLTAMQKADALVGVIQMEDASLDLFDLKMQFKRMRFTKYQVKTKVSEKRQEVEESWEFDYESVKFTYRPDRQTGKMNMEIYRAPGSPSGSNDKYKEFAALARDMNVQALNELFQKLRKEAEEREKKGAAQ